MSRSYIGSLRFVCKIKKVESSEDGSAGDHHEPLTSPDEPSGAASPPVSTVDFKACQCVCDKDSCQCVSSVQRQHLLVHVARTKGYTKLMLGDNCTRIAVKLLTSISLGRGAHLAQDTVRLWPRVRGSASLQATCDWLFSCVFVSTGILRLQVW